MKQELQDTDDGETDVKQSVCPVPSPVAKETRHGRELEKELPPPRIQSTPRLEEAISIPKYKTEGDWRCFVADFKDIMRLVDLKLSH